MSHAEGLKYNDFAKKESMKNIPRFKFLPQTRVDWDEGLQLKSEDGNFKLKLDGRIMRERCWFDEYNDIFRSIEGQLGKTEFNRANLNLSSEIYKNTGFTAQYNFNLGGKQSFNDVYIELKKIPFLGNFRVGHLKEPFSLEYQTSSEYVTFMEKNLNNVFNQSRNIGFILYNHILEKRVTWTADVFRITDDSVDKKSDRTSKDGYSFSGRITGLPMYKGHGNKLVHTGFSYSYKNAFESKFSLGSSQEFHPADDYVDTGKFAAESAHLFNPELTVIYGPFSLQSEYTFANINFDRDTPGRNLDFTGFYISGSYFLTGAHNKYDRETGKLVHVMPNNNFYWGENIGAIELTARYSKLDLPYKSDGCEKLSDTTLGINWYLNQNTKIVFNYVYADGRRIKDGDGELAAMHFQINF